MAQSFLDIPPRFDDVGFLSGGFWAVSGFACQNGLVCICVTLDDAIRLEEVFEALQQATG